MVRITCDSCHQKSFEVFTFERMVDVPEGWMNVATWGLGLESSRYSRTMLYCPACVTKVDNDSRIDKPYSINIEFKKDGDDWY